jgi:hypothetical protein
MKRFKLAKLFTYMVAKVHEPVGNIDFNTSKNKAANLIG